MGRHQGAEHAAAALVAVDLLRHDRLGGRSMWVLYPAWPLLTGYDHAACSAIRRARASSRAGDGRGAGAQAVRWTGSPARRRSTRSAADPELLRLRHRRRPRRRSRTTARSATARRRRAHGLSQPRRRRLALGRHARPRSSTTIRTASATAGCRDARVRRCRPSAPTSILTPEQIDDVAEYVLSLSGSASGRRRGRRAAQRSSPRTARPAMARTGDGKRELGAPASTTRSGSMAATATAIVAQITKPAPRRDAGLGRPARRDDDQDAGRLRPLAWAAASSGAERDAMAMYRLSTSDLAAERRDVAEVAAAALRRARARSIRKRASQRHASARSNGRCWSCCLGIYYLVAVAALGPRAGRARPGGAGRHGRPAALLLLASRSGRRNSTT